jgi:hypothetical protein
MADGQEPVAPHPMTTLHSFDLVYPGPLSGAAEQQLYYILEPIERGLYRACAVQSGQVITLKDGDCLVLGNLWEVGTLVRSLYVLADQLDGSGGEAVGWLAEHIEEVEAIVTNRIKERET